MTRLDGLALPEAEAAIEAACPGWRIRHDHGVYAARGGIELPVPSVLRAEEAIAQWEHAHREAS